MSNPSHPNARKPDYTFRALHKKSELKATVGVAWRNEDGSISIALNSFTTLSQDGHLVLTLFPKEEQT